MQSTEFLKFTSETVAHLKEVLKSTDEAYVHGGGLIFTKYSPKDNRADHIVTAKQASDASIDGANVYFPNGLIRSYRKLYKYVSEVPNTPEELEKQVVEATESEKMRKTREMQAPKTVNIVTLPTVGQPTDKPTPPVSKTKE
jgi:hypothetical protein